MTTMRRTFDLLAALLVGATAGWALLAPLAPNFGISGTDGQLTALMTSRPLASAVGLVVAATLAGALSRRGSARAARMTTLVGLGVLVAVQYSNDGVWQLEWLIAVTWVSGIAAGVALGGAAAAAGDRTETAVLLGAAVAAFLVVPVTSELLGRAPEQQWTPYAPLTDAGTLTSAPAWMLLLPAIVATAFATALGGARPAKPSTRGVAVTATVVATSLAANAAIAAAQDNRPLTGALLAVFVAVTIGAAFLLDGQDGSLLLTTTAIAAAVAPLSGWSDTTWIGVVILIVGLTVGVVVGSRWPSVVVGLTLLAAVSLAGLLPDIADGTGGAVRWLAVAPIAGYALGSCDPIRSGATIAGLSVLFVPSALSVAGQGAPDLLEDRSPLRSLPRGMMASMPPDPYWLTTAMTVVGLATIAAAGILRQRAED